MHEGERSILSMSVFYQATAGCRTGRRTAPGDPLQKKPFLGVLCVYHADVVANLPKAGLSLSCATAHTHTPHMAQRPTGEPRPFQKYVH